jgi:hypothetical protein
MSHIRQALRSRATNLPRAAGQKPDLGENRKVAVDM